MSAHLCHRNGVCFCGSCRKPNGKVRGQYPRVLNYQRQCLRYLAQPFALSFHKLMARGVGRLGTLLWRGQDDHARKVPVHTVRGGARDIRRDGHHLKAIHGGARHPSLQNASEIYGPAWKPCYKSLIEKGGQSRCRRLPSKMHAYDSEACTLRERRKTRCRKGVRNSAE